jgi:phosphate transport system substrate-binding protein
MKTHPGMPVKSSASGTVEGFARFCRGELDLVDASRAVTRAEQAACDAGGIAFIELPVAYDALTVIVNAGNTWASSMTVSELRTLWEPKAEKRIVKWNQVRSDWPDRPIRLFGPGPESGTFDYFTQAVTGTVDASRTDYTASGDDTVIVAGVAGDVEALGYVGYSYFDDQRKTLKALAIDDEDESIGRGAIEPSPLQVARGVYRPFARPLFIYVNESRLLRPEVKAFVDSYLRRAGELAADAGTMPLMATTYKLATQRLAKAITGTMYRTREDARLGIDLLLSQSEAVQTTSNARP